MLKIRDFLLQMDAQNFDVCAVKSFFSVGNSAAQEIAGALVTRGWSEASDRSIPQHYFRVTQAGRQLALARGSPRITRAKADKELHAFLERVAEVNGRDEFAYKVTEVRAFGSYIDEAASDLGDIDLVVFLEWRDPTRDKINYNYERADLSGKPFKSSLERMFYGEIEVKLFLKNRNRYISIHDEGDLSLPGIASKIIFSSATSTPRAW